MEDSVELSLREAVEALSIPQEAVRVYHGVVHLDGEGDRHIKGHQVPGNAAAKPQVSKTCSTSAGGVAGTLCMVEVELEKLVKCLTCSAHIDG